MKFYILDNGWETLDKSFMIAGANTGKVQNPNPVNEWIDIPIQAYLISHDDGYILFDTGCDPDWERSWPPFIAEQSPYYVKEEQLLLNRLKQLGVKPEDIKYVVISHLHVDHAGNLYQFKNAEIFVNENEFLQTLKGYATGKDLDVHVPCDIQRFIDARLNWHLLGSDIKEYELVPGVTLLNLGSGHSFGMVSMRVDLENSGRFLIVADAIYLEENVFPQVQVPGILYDSLGYKKTAKYLVEYAQENNCKILFGHDIKQFRTLKKAPDEFYD